MSGLPKLNLRARNLVHISSPQELRAFLVSRQLRGMTHHMGVLINTETKKGCAGLTPGTAFLKSVLPLKPLFIEGLDL